MRKLFAVRDVKADCFESPMALPTLGIAIRSFVEACGDPKGDFNRYPEDYMLYEIGSYDPNSGLVTPHSLPKLVISASEALVQYNQIVAAKSRVVVPEVLGGVK